MTDLKNGTWVLVADGEKALFLENVTDRKNPHDRTRQLTTFPDKAVDWKQHGLGLSSPKRTYLPT